MTDAPPRLDMVWIPAGGFSMGSDRFYPEEAPVHPVEVAGFWIDRHPITNDRFARFVDETGYVTVAERPLDPPSYPGADPSLLRPGGLVFQRTPGPVPLHDVSRWWAYVPGADWRHPQGPASSLDGLGTHPVVQVAHEDAEAYATHTATALPSEAEWERAARGGLEGADYTWGDEPEPAGGPPANTWQGRFPWENLLTDGYEGTSPVGAFAPNGFGLHDMAGNVWEWTTDWWQDRHGPAESPCCGPAVGPFAHQGGSAAASAGPGETIPRKVIKGGSHLCAPNYCLRYRPAARQPEAVDTATCHLGFRTIVRLGDRPGAPAVDPGEES